MFKENCKLKTIESLSRTTSNSRIEEFKKAFYSLVENNVEKAIDLINDETLNFGSLYSLQTEIGQFKLFEKLNVRNKAALETVDKILKKKVSEIEYLSSHYIKTKFDVLKWMLETGFIDDGLSDEYDELLDTAAALLITEFRDRAVLPIIVHMIFERYKKGFFIHDLVWAFFQCGEPKSLLIIADRLRSKEQKDIELACKLLSFVPELDSKAKIDREKLYLYFINWFEENQLFLHFTGESFNQCSNPMPYVVVLDAKYLCKAVSVDTGEILKPLTETETKLVDVFKKLDYKTKMLLSSFSFRIYLKDIQTWNKWINYPIEQQISTANNILGGVQ